MKHVFTSTLALALLASAPALADGRIDLMTQNQYLGADLNPVIAAPNPPAFNAAVLQALSQVAANDFETRAELLAKLIAGRLPDLVGLQEVFKYECTPIAPPPPSGGCSNPSIAGAFNDHLTLTLAALDALGENYVDVATVQNFSVQIPVDTDFNGAPDILVSVLDRDVILATEAVEASATVVDYSAFCPGRVSADGCNYLVAAEANTAVGPIRQDRGWVGVDVTVDGKDYRFVNTHLEVQRPSPSPLSPFIQAAQSAELIGVLGASTPSGRSLIVVGDINSSSEDPVIPGPLPLPPPFNQGIIPPYTQLVAAGYTDAWTLVGDIPGFSCCQSSDLSNHSSILDERIDVIFSREQPDKAKKKRVLGDNIPDKSAPDGLWPSDHGSVAVQLEFEE
jgi:hypothetical protein